MGAGEAKLAFRRQCVLLSDEDVPESNAEVWESFWSLPASLEDVYATLEPGSIREVRKSRPENLKVFIRKAVAKLTSFLASEGGLKQDEIKQATNCARLLSRMMPFLLEDDSDGFVEACFWQTRLPKPNVAVAAEGEGAIETEPLAVSMLNALLKLCFKIGFTVSAPYRAEELEDRGFLWENGVGGGKVGSPNFSYDSNRSELLRCLLMCLCGTLFLSPEQAKVRNDKWMVAATTGQLDGDTSRMLFRSLLNVVFSYDPVGWGVPYATYLVADPRETLLDGALQLVLVLVDFKMVTDPSTTAANIFRSHLAEISDADELQFILDGFVRLLNNPHQANNTYLPSSIKQISSYQELLILFWKLLDENKHFLHHCLRSHSINNFVVPVLYFMHEGRKDPSKFGLIHICTFILLLLSGERNFCVSLNRPFVQRLPIDLPAFAGNHADLLFIVFHKLITNGPEKLSTLYDCFLTVMSNISPYIKAFSLPTSLRLMNLFERFISPKVLYANEQNHRYVFFLLEIFNNCIQYQYEGNVNVVYAILRRKVAFEHICKVTGLEMSKSSDKPAAATAPADGAEQAAATAEASSTAGEAAGAMRTTTEAAAMPGGAETAAAGTDWKPTPEWVKSWKDKLPLQTVLRLLHYLLPQVESFCNSTGVTDENQIVEFLRKTTLVGLLPVPHPILIRKYTPNEYTNLWFTTFIWGVIYLRNHTPPCFDSQAIKLFTVSFVDNQEPGGAGHQH